MVDKRWIINLSGKEYVQFPGLLDLAHSTGLCGIVTELVQIPTSQNGNTAIVRAECRFRGEDGGNVWAAFGDASPANVNARIASAVIRMAETRAIGRALRMATNVGQTMAEELPDEDEAPAPRSGRGTAAPAAHDPAPITCQAAGCGEILSEDIARACRKYWRSAVYCTTHGRQMVAAGQVDHPQEKASASAAEGQPVG